MATTLIPTMDEGELYELTLAAREAVKHAEAKANADPSNAALRAHVTMARQKLATLLGERPAIRAPRRPSAPVTVYETTTRQVCELAEGTRFCLVCNPSREGRVIRHGIGSTVVRYGTNRTVTIGERSFEAAGEMVTIAQTSRVRAAVEG